MILVVEHATDLQPIPQEPRRCSLEQALRNMGWPAPEATAAMHAAAPRPRPQRPLPRRVAPAVAVPAPAVTAPPPRIRPLPLRPALAALAATG